MERNTLMMLAALLPSFLLAGPAAKVDPVAEGYPDWSGLTAKNRICGREIFPSDLRHKVTVVVEIEPNEKLQSQLALAGKFAIMTGLTTVGELTDWDNFEIPRSLIVVISNRGAKNHEAIMGAAKYKGEDTILSGALAAVRGNGCSVYDDLTFTGAPDSTGKRPYYYVMGPTGKEPIAQGELTAAAIKDAQAKITKAIKDMDSGEVKWRPFYGNLEDSKYHAAIAKALEKGKTAKVSPLQPIEKAILKDVVLKDEERAKTAQILYDALNQTRNDLFLRVLFEVSCCPHRAYYDASQLVKFWPSEKKRLENVYAKFKAYPELEPLAKAFCKMQEWASPDFTCKNAGEAKKIVQELNKMKKMLEKLKESKNIQIQNGALLMDMKVDELLAAIPAKVAAK